MVSPQSADNRFLSDNNSMDPMSKAYNNNNNNGPVEEHPGDTGNAMGGPKLQRQHHVHQTCMEKIFGSGGFVASTCNLNAFTLGMGILGMGMAMLNAGILLGVILIILGGAFATMGNHLYIMSADATMSATCDEISLKLFGIWGQRVTSIMMILLLSGIVVLYLIAIGAPVELIRQIDNSPDIFEGYWGRRLFTTVTFMIFSFPLCLLKNVNHLRFSSVIAVLVIFVIVIAVGIIAARPNRGTTKNFKVVTISTKTMLSLSTILFGYLYLPSSPGVYREMKNRTVKKMLWVAITSTTIAAIVSASSGVVAYYLYGDQVLGSVLENFKDENPLQTWYVFVGFIALFFMLAFSTPLVLIPARDAILVCLHYTPMSIEPTLTEREKHSSVRNLNRSCTEGMSISGANPNIDFGVNYPLCVCPSYVRLYVAGMLCVACLTLSMFVPKVDIMFGLVGSFSTGYICYAMPALFVLRMYRGSFTVARRGWGLIIITYLCLVFGIFAIFFGTGLTIYNIYMDEK